MAAFDKAQGPIDLFTVTFESGSDLIAENMLLELGVSQYQVVPCAVANSKNVIGVCTKTGVTVVLTGNPVPVRVHGVVTVIADDGSIVAGDFLKSGTTTKDRVTSATGAANIVGRAYAGSNAAGDSLTMWLQIVPGVTIV